MYRHLPTYALIIFSMLLCGCAKSKYIPKASKFDSSYFYVENIHDNPKLKVADSLYILANKPHQAIELYKDVFLNKGNSDCQRAFAIERSKEVRNVYDINDASGLDTIILCSNEKVRYLHYHNLKLDDYKNLSRDSVSDYISIFHGKNEHFFNHARTLMVEALHRSENDIYESAELAKEIEAYYRQTNNRTFDKYLLNLKSIIPYKVYFGDLYAAYFANRLKLNEEFDFELIDFNYVNADLLLHHNDKVKPDIQFQVVYDENITDSKIDILSIDSIANFLYLNEKYNSLEYLMDNLLYSILNGNNMHSIDSINTPIRFNDDLYDFRKVTNVLNGHNVKNTRINLANELLEIQNERYNNNGGDRRKEFEILLTNDEYVTYIKEYLNIKKNGSFYYKLSELFRSRKNYNMSLFYLNEYVKHSVPKKNSIEELLDISTYDRYSSFALLGYSLHLFSKYSTQQKLGDLVEFRDVNTKISNLINELRYCFQSDIVVSNMESALETAIGFTKSANRDLFAITQDSIYLKENFSLIEFSKFSLKGYKDLVFKNEIDEDKFMNYIQLINETKSVVNDSKNLFSSQYIENFNLLHELKYEVFQELCTKRSIEDKFTFDFKAIAKISQEVPIVNFSLDYNGVSSLSIYKGKIKNNPINFDFSKFEYLNQYSFGISMYPYLNTQQRINHLANFEQGKKYASKIYSTLTKYPLNSTIIIIGNLFGGVPKGLDFMADENGEYLVNKYNFIYASNYSSAVKLFKQENITTTDIQAFAYTRLEEQPEEYTYEYPLLYGAADELSIIDSLFDNHNNYYGGEYSKENLTEAIESSSKILHIATHGSLLQSIPFLILNTENNKLDSLYSFEIGKLNSNVECVVLSSCNSAYSTNGITSDYSLAYAFHNSGVKYVIAPYGPIDDETTTTIIKYFYENIAKGQDPHWALTNAKREYLKSSSLVHPHYWAPLNIYI